MTNTANAQQLVSQQLSQLHSLKCLLDEEKQVLQNHNPDDLTELTNNKNNLLIEIKDLDLTIARSVEFAQNKAAGQYQSELDEIKTFIGV